MKMRSLVGLALTTLTLLSAVFVYKAYAGTLSEPEEALKTTLFSAQYESYLPEGWFNTSKLSSNLTRTDAAYLALYTLSKGSGVSIDWMEYKTKLSDTKDTTLSKAVDAGLMSVGTDLKFNGSKTISQQEFAVIMTKVASKLKVYQKPTKALSFKDSKTIASWAKESVQYLQQNNWTIWVKNNTFEPEKAITYGRAIALSDQFLATNKAYAQIAVAEKKSGQTYDLEGYKVPNPVLGLSEWDINLSGSGQLKMSFNGLIKNRTANTHKTIIYQLIDILDSNSEVSYNARSTLLTTLKEHWDATEQSYNFDKTLYIRLDNGQIASVKPKEKAIEIAAGNMISIEITK